MKGMTRFIVAALAAALVPSQPSAGEASAREPAESPRAWTETLRLEDLISTRARPLFSPTRRPPSPAPQALSISPSHEKEHAAPEAPPFDLIGAAVGDRMSFVLIRNRATKKVTRVRLGDEADGWRVSAVGLRSATFARDGRENSLAFAAPRSAPVAEIAAIALVPKPSAGEEGREEKLRKFRLGH